MRFRLTLAMFALVLLGMSQKPKVTVRFHAETTARDTDTFAIPVKLAYAGRAAHLHRVPELSERQIKAIFPFKTPDGTWGCFFQFDEQGRFRLETLSNQQRGAALVLFIGTKGGQHQVIDMLVDAPVTTGALTVPRGITDAETAVLRQQFKVMGQEKSRGKPKPEKKDAITDTNMDRGRDQRTLSPPPPPPPAPVPSRKLPELPREAD